MSDRLAPQIPNPERKPPEPKRLCLALRLSQDRFGAREELKIEPNMTYLIGRKTDSDRIWSEVLSDGQSLVEIESQSRKIKKLLMLSRKQLAVRFIDSDTIKIQNIGENEVKIGYGRSFSGSLTRRDLGVGSKINLNKGETSKFDSINLQVELWGNENVDIVLEFTGIGSGGFTIVPYLRPKAKID